MLSCFSRVQLFVTPWTIARQAPLSMRFSRQEYWSGFPCPPPGDLPNPGIKPVSRCISCITGGIFTTEPPEKPMIGAKAGLGEKGDINSLRLPAQCCQDIQVQISSIQSCRNGKTGGDAVAWRNLSKAIVTETTELRFLWTQTNSKKLWLKIKKANYRELLGGPVVRPPHFHLWRPGFDT